MADGFDGVTFVALREGGYRTLPNRKAAVTERHAVGGDVSYFDYGGRLPGEWRGLVELASQAVLNTLAGKLGTSGTLTLNGTTYTAILMDIAEAKLRPLGVIVHASVIFKVAV